MPRINAIEAALRAAGASAAGVRLFDARRGLAAPDPDSDNLYFGIANAATVRALKAALESRYRPHHPATAVSRPASRQQQVRSLTVAQLEQIADMPPPVSVFVPAPPPQERATMEGLRGIVARLRGPGGCPWDRQQDPRTLRRCLLEETHEALAAIDRQDPKALAEELGDILLLVLLHAQLAAEQGEFDFAEVVARIHAKLVARHPHVFGTARVSDAETVLRRWEQLKREETGRRAGDLLCGVAPTLPALDQAQKVQRRASHLGFDWARIEGPLAKLAEELAEFQAALESEAPGSERLEQEIGDLLFAAVNVARFAGVDAEQALRTAVQRFAARFAAMEQLAAQQGHRLETMNLEQMDRLWDRVKTRE